MNKKVMTVNGEVEVNSLGITDLHEHTFCDLRVAGAFLKNYFKNIPTSMLEFVPENFAFLKQGVYLISEECAYVDDIDFLIKEFKYLKDAGCKTIVDCSPIGARGTGKQMLEFSQKTGLQMVCATGIYTETSRPQELLGRDEEFYYNTFKREIEEGIDESGVKPGILKAAIATYGPDGKIADGEMAGVRAVARLSAETGLSAHIHTDPNISGRDVADVIKNMITLGATPDKIHICHMDNRLAAEVSMSDYLMNADVGRNINLDTQKELLDMGVTIGFDTWGMPITNPQFFMADDFERLKAIIQLIKMGYENQITIGCDFSSKIMGRSYGNYGCTRFMEFAVPLLKQYGHEKALEKILVENPARILSY